MNEFGLNLNFILGRFAHFVYNTRTISKMCLKVLTVTRSPIYRTVIFKIYIYIISLENDDYKLRLYLNRSFY